MEINLYDVLSVPGTDKTIEGKLTELTRQFQGECIRITGDDVFPIHLSYAGKDCVTVETDVKLHVVRTCSRCLEDVNCEYDLHIFRNLNTATKEAYIESASEADEVSYIEDCTLDVDELVLDELFTVIPMNVLCKEDCKGICKVCGTNLNQNTCDCDQTVPDPRMAVFSNIFNQFKEV